MFINNFDPVAFEFLSIEIRWYSLAYIFGILLGWSFCKKKLSNNKELNDSFDDLLTFVILGIILGGRLGYILFYNLEYYLNNLHEIFFIWNGGMSFHGGLIGIFISSYYYCKKNKLNMYIYLDLISMAAPIGLFFGRIANFINSELYGRETDVLWSVKFINIDNISRHPSQIYEAIFEGIILFFLLMYLNKKSIFSRPGVMSSFFLILYSLFRFILEFYREPDPHLGFLIANLTMGQLLSFVLFFLGTYLYYIKKNEN